jgi:hypothetical protein
MRPTPSIPFKTVSHHYNFTCTKFLLVLSSWTKITAFWISPRKILIRRTLHLLYDASIGYLTTLFTLLITYLLTPWFRTLLEKLIVTQLFKKHPAFFMEPEGSLPCSQKPATGTYSKSSESSSPHRSLLPKIQLNVILPPTPRSSQWSAVHTTEECDGR